MGVSLDHSVAVNFANEDDANRFLNYVNRALTDKHINRSSGGDIEAFKNADYNHLTSWVMSEVFDAGYEDNYVDSYCWDDTVSLESHGYGNIPAFLLYSAITQYNAQGIFWKSQSCQGQEDMDFFVNWNRQTVSVCELPQYAKSAL